MYRINGHKTDRIAILLRQEGKLFHTQDLALLWAIADRNTLYTTIKRYIDRGILFPVQKGLYSVLPIEQVPVENLVVKIIHAYTYLSTETVLIRAGIIMQVDFALTFVSSVSRRFPIREQQIICRKLAPGFLFNPLDVIRKDDYYCASTERAVADLLYFNPTIFLDGARLIDWERVRFIQKEVGYL